MNLDFVSPTQILNLTSTCQNPTPTILSQWFWNELGLCLSNTNSESHGTFLRLASEVHLMPFFRPLQKGPHLTIHACQCS
jgi:hypothetical protein